MLPLNTYEIKVLCHLLKRWKDREFCVTDLDRSITLGEFKLRRTLKSLEDKKLVSSKSRTRTKPYVLSERGQAFAWLASLSNKQILDMHTRHR